MYRAHILHNWISIKWMFYEIYMLELVWVRDTYGFQSIR